MRLTRAGLSLPGWPEAASPFCFSSSFLVVLIPHSSFSTGILVSSPSVAFLLLISAFQVRHETEEWGEVIWERKRRHSKVCGFIFITEHLPVYWSLSSPPRRGNTVQPFRVRSGRVFFLHKRCEARAKLKPRMPFWAILVCMRLFKVVVSGLKLIVGQ